MSVPSEDNSPVPSPTTKVKPKEESHWHSVTDKPQPIPFAISYSHPLHSIISHSSTSKELIVSDSQGSIFDVDWRYDPVDEHPENGYRGLSVAQLIEPRALADARTGMQTVWSGAVDWHPVDANMWVAVIFIFLKEDLALIYCSPLALVELMALGGLYGTCETYKAESRLQRARHLSMALAGSGKHLGKGYVTYYMSLSLQLLSDHTKPVWTHTFVASRGCHCNHIQHCLPTKYSTPTYHSTTSSPGHRL